MLCSLRCIWALGSLSSSLCSAPGRPRPSSRLPGVPLPEDPLCVCPRHLPRPPPHLRGGQRLRPPSFLRGGMRLPPAPPPPGTSPGRRANGRWRRQSPPAGGAGAGRKWRRWRWAVLRAVRGWSRLGSGGWTWGYFSKPEGGGGGKYGKEAKRKKKKSRFWLGLCVGV